MVPTNGVRPQLPLLSLLQQGSKTFAPTDYLLNSITKHLDKILYTLKFTRYCIPLTSVIPRKLEKTNLT